MLMQEIMERESSLQVAMELTEYVAAGAWEKYHQTESILRSISAKDIVGLAHEIFDERHIVVGEFIGTKNI